MLRFLSPEWLQAFDEALGADRDLPARFAASPIAIAQEVDDDSNSIRYVILLDADGGRIETGADAPADVTFVCRRGTASALAQGELNAQRALTSGRLKVRGEVERLAAASTALAGLGDILATLRADTEF